MFTCAKQESPASQAEHDDFLHFSSANPESPNMAATIKEEDTSEPQSDTLLVEHSNDTDALQSDYGQMKYILGDKLIEVNNNSISLPETANECSLIKNEVCTNGSGEDAKMASVPVLSMQTVQSELAAVSAKPHATTDTKPQAKTHHDTFTEFLQKQAELHQQQQQQEQQLQQQSQLQQLKHIHLQLQAGLKQENKDESNLGSIRPSRFSSISRALSFPVPTQKKDSESSVLGSSLSGSEPNLKSSDKVEGLLSHHKLRTAFQEQQQMQTQKRQHHLSGSSVSRSPTSQVHHVSRPQSLPIGLQGSSGRSEMKSPDPALQQISHLIEQSKMHFHRTTPLVQSPTSATGQSPLSPQTFSSLVQQSEPAIRQLLLQPPQQNSTIIQQQSGTISHQPQPIKGTSLIVPHSPQIPQSPNVPKSPRTPLSPHVTQSTHSVIPQSPTVPHSPQIPSSPVVPLSPHIPSSPLPKVASPQPHSGIQSPSPIPTQQKGSILNMPAIQQMQSLLNMQSTEYKPTGGNTVSTSVSGNQQVSLLPPLPFTRGPGTKLPTAEVRPMHMVDPKLVSGNVIIQPQAAKTATSVPKVPKLGAPTDNLSVTSQSQSKPFQPPHRQSKAQQKGSKSRRRKPSNSVSPMQKKTTLPTNGIRIKHEPLPAAMIRTINDDAQLPRTVVETQKYLPVLHLSKQSSIPASVNLNNTEPPSAIVITPSKIASQSSTPSNSAPSTPKNEDVIPIQRTPSPSMGASSSPIVPSQAVSAPNAASSVPNFTVSVPGQTFSVSNPAISTSNSAMSLPSPAISVASPALSAPSPSISAPSPSISAPSPALSTAGSDSDLLSLTEDETTGDKPSDSTKKIILALTEKLKKKQSRKPHSPDQKVSIHDLKDIIKDTMDSKPAPIKDPDGFVYDPMDICRGLGHIPLKPSLLGDPSKSRYTGPPRGGRSRASWHKGPHQLPPLPPPIPGQPPLQQAPRLQSPLTHSVPAIAQKTGQQSFPQGMQSGQSVVYQTAISQEQLLRQPVEKLPPGQPVIAVSAASLPPPPQVTDKALENSSEADDRATLVTQASPINPIPRSQGIPQASIAPTTTAMPSSVTVLHSGGDTVLPSSNVGSTMQVVPPAKCTTVSEASSTTVTQTPPLTTITNTASIIASGSINKPVIPPAVPSTPRIKSPVSHHATIVSTATTSKSTALKSVHAMPVIPVDGSSCPTEPFGSMSRESLQQPLSIIPHIAAQTSSNLSPVNCVPVVPQNNIVMISPQAHCPVPPIPLPTPAIVAAPPAAALGAYQCDLKSPDSGYNETCVSPLDISLPVSQLLSCLIKLTPS